MIMVMVWCYSVGVVFVSVSSRRTLTGSPESNMLYQDRRDISDKTPETLYHRDEALLYITYVMLI